MRYYKTAFVAEYNCNALMRYYLRLDSDGSHAFATKKERGTLFDTAEEAIAAAARHTDLPSDYLPAQAVEVGVPVEMTSVEVLQAFHDLSPAERGKAVVCLQREICKPIIPPPVQRKRVAGRDSDSEESLE